MLITHTTLHALNSRRSPSHLHGSSRQLDCQNKTKRVSYKAQEQGTKGDELGIVRTRDVRRRTRQEERPPVQLAALGR